MQIPSSLMMCAFCLGCLISAHAVAGDHYVDQVLQDAPTGYWRFEDEAIADGSTVIDAIDHSRRPTIADSSDSSALARYHGEVNQLPGVPGIGGLSLKLDGSTTYVEVPLRASHETIGLTVEFWFKGDRPFDHVLWPGDGVLVAKGALDDSQAGWAIAAGSPIAGNDQGRLAAVTTGSAHSTEKLFSNPSIQLNDDKWHHVVFTRSHVGNQRFYVDGRSSATSKDRGGSFQNHEALYIGGSGSSDRPSHFHGAIDEVAIYDQVLTADRVASHYYAALYGSQLPPRAEHLIDYKQDILPILSSHCFDCHAHGTEEGGLNLAVRARVREGGDNVQPIVPGASLASPLIHFVSGCDPVRKMPPADNKPLTAEDIGILRAWIDQGAVWPDADAGVDDRVARAQQHWALRPIQRPGLPLVKDQSWVINPIDAFILARLDKENRRPSPRAEPLTLLRRASFDLIGLPPTISQIEMFARLDRDDAESQNAYRQMVHELLESPHYGERYARHWLDVVRYADSAGYELDTFYNHAWRYRDYVISAFQNDKPFDRFIQEQLAADELWPEDESLRYATGLLAVGPYHYESGIARPEIPEYKWLTDTADTIGSAFMGMTVGCARCHSHKFDSISQKDYFGLHAILSGSTLWDTRLNRPPDNSDERRKPQNWIVTHRSMPPLVNVLQRGEQKTPGLEAVPTIFQSLVGGGILEEPDTMDFKKRRTKLARWLTSRDNPLTARVIVNRVWQWHFGEGLVRTSNDFGTQGTPPTHPELLDYLACELMDHDWSLKYLHRLIMESNTYQMHSRPMPSKFASNEGATSERIYDRFPRRRLEAEAIWDNLLATSGAINLQRFGEPVLPPIDRATLANKRIVTWNAAKERSTWARRGIYVIVRRSVQFPFFETFNQQDPSASCAVRDTTVVSPQSLTMLNDETMLEIARVFAGRLIRESNDLSDRPSVVRRGWSLAYGRYPDDAELTASVQFIDAMEKHFAASDQQTLASPIDHAASVQKDLPPWNGAEFSPSRGAALVEFCRALFNSNEFMYID